MHLQLTRHSRAKQTLGVLRLMDQGSQVWWCCTIELPWRDNERRKSCIPPGPSQGPKTYQVDHRRPEGDWSAFRYPHFIVQGVEGRTAILFHAGNYLSDTAGCILVGRSFSDLDGDGLTDVTASRETLAEMVEEVPEEGVDLKVQWSQVADMRRMVADEMDLDISQIIAQADIEDTRGTA